ncbi:MAG TPA: LiaF domain-containing protein [Hanamia sp.]|nr:LiaF domain-containing protein [Hanamia sp.]
MEPNNIEMYNRNKRSRIWSGLILVIAGILLLGYKMGAPIPGWIFTWPVLLIAIGLLIGVKSKFHNPGAMIMILIGAVFLLDEQIPGIDFHNYIVPIILISVGIIFILRPRSHGCSRRSRRWERMNIAAHDNFKSEPVSSSDDNSEYLDVVAVFGGIKKNVQSKNFKGGEIVSFMGGSEINFMHADIQQPIELEVNNVFGGTKLIIPSNWDVKNEISAVFGGVEDKRTFSNSLPDTDKKIVLKGACVFGGIEVTNY